MCQIYEKSTGANDMKMKKGGEVLIMEKSNLQNELCDKHNIIVYRGIRMCQNCAIVFGPVSHPSSLK
ncbi:MAG: hypothetical protein ACFFCM_02280 [Promethearchaeota archaeon]